MITVFSIPLLPQAQSLNISLAGVTYAFFLNWNSFSEAWTLDIASNQQKMVSGIPLVADTDLLAQYEYMNFGGALIAATIGQQGVPPTYDNLGAAGQLYFVVTTDEQ